MRPRNLIAYCIYGALVGVSIILLPAFIRQPSSSLLLLYRQSMKASAGLIVLLLFLAGCAWGFKFERPRGWIAAFFQTASLPLFAIVEMFQDPTSHNLWPFEFVIYLLMGGVGFIGAVIGYAVARRAVPRTAR